MLYINSNADEIPNKQCKYSFAQYPFFDGIGCPAPYDINLIIESDSFYCQIAHNWLTMSYPKYVYYIYEEPYIYADPKFRLIKEPNGGEIKKIFYSY
jgi:hypothetical protein